MLAATALEQDERLVPQGAEAVTVVMEGPVPAMLLQGEAFMAQLLARLTWAVAEGELQLINCRWGAREAARFISR